jgi:hypothetical protein
MTSGAATRRWWSTMTRRASAEEFLAQARSIATTQTNRYLQSQYAGGT